MDKKIVRRLLPLLVLGSAVALVVVQFSRMVTHDVDVQLLLSSELTQGLEQMELTVRREDGEIASMTQFRFDDQHRPQEILHHLLRLSSGNYKLTLTFLFAGAGSRELSRELGVSGDASVSLHLP